MTDTTQADDRTDAEPLKRKVAEHYLIDAQGATVENEEEATGIGYKLLALADKPFTYQIPGAVAGSAQTMLAVFGAKTLATNETSQARNGKTAGGPQEQWDAVSDRFALITGSESEAPKWIDRTREGVGAKVDKPALAQAILQANPGMQRTVEEVVAKLESDPAYMRNARTVPAVQAAYAAILGRPAKTVDDLAF